MYRSPSRSVFQVCNYLLFTIFAISIIVPFMNAISISLSSYEALSRGGIGIWPQGFNTRAYVTLVENSAFLRSFVNSVCITAVNTVLVIIISLSAAYALSYKNLPGKNIIFTYMLVTMYFSGGLIPTYLLVNAIGLTNTYFALILPGITNIFYVIIFKNVIDQLPKELLECAQMDGASEMRVLFNIVLPLVLPMTMAFTIFSAVAYWNDWFSVLLYIKDKSMWTLQYALRDILFNTAPDMANQDNIATNGYLHKVHPENIKMAALMLTVLPIIVVYPFVQKYFIKGALVGAVKG